MDPQVFRSQLDALVEQLATRDPDPAHLWVGESRALDEIHKRAVWLLDNHGGIESISDNQSAALRVRLYLCDRISVAAALFEVAGRSKDARALLERCIEVCPDAGDRKLYEAAAGDLPAFAKLVRARWLWGQQKHDDARRIAGGINSSAAVINEAAQYVVKAPTPINEAPALFSLNGFGARFYGQSDMQPDGSHVTVRFVTALFVPVFPIDAYRVTTYGDGYNIRGKVPLGPIMRAWQFIAAGLIVLAIGWAVISSVLNSPERQLRLAVEDVVELESVDREGALERYETLAVEYNGIDSDADLLPVAQGWVRMATAEIPNPITPAAVDQVTAIVNRYAALPSRMQKNSLAEPFVDRLLDWSDQLPTDTAEGADARLELLVAADRFAPTSRRERVDAAFVATRMALAAQLAVDWPIEALRQYTKLLEHEPRARTEVTKLLAALPESPTLFAEIIPELELWAPYVDEGDKVRAGDLGRRGLELSQDPERAAILQANDEAQLRALLTADPTDQVVTVVLAHMQRARGQLDEAVAQLEALGKPGLMIHEAQHLLAELEFDRGRDEQAAILLEQMLRNRLPAFEDARRAFEGEFNRLRDNLVARAEQGQFPAKYKSALTGTDDVAAREAFGQWLDEEIQQSPALTRMQADYLRQTDIVPVAILLGTVQLQRARAVTGEERDRLLDSAQSTFLSIGSEATGMPEYHLALGQVYFRLGKTTQGKAEFQYLTENPDAFVQLLAAGGYRELGQFDEARKIAEAVNQSNPTNTDVMYRAATLRSVLAFDLDERRTWLERGNQQDEYIRTSLLDVEAEQLLRDGKFAAADKKYAEVYELQVKVAERDRGSYNNAALTLINRHACTGDLRHVEQAVELMQRSVALKPDAGIVVINYASILDFQAQLGIIDRFIPTEGLRISQSETGVLLDALTHSSKREEVLAVIREDTQRVRALDVWKRGETLSPQQPAVYLGQLEWLGLPEHVEQVSELVERVRAVEGIDTSDYARYFEEHVNGTSDEQTLQLLTAKLEARVAVREQSKRASPAVRAVLLHLDGENLQERAGLQRGAAALADARAAVEAFEAAGALWSEGLGTSALADALLLVAVFDLEVQNPDSTAQWHEHWRFARFSLTFANLYDARAPLLDELKRHPAFVRSLELRRAAPDDNLGQLDVVLATIVGDEALRTRALAECDQPLQQQAVEIGQLLAPFDSSGPRMRAWIDAHRG